VAPITLTFTTATPLPGDAWLEWKVDTDEAGTRLCQLARFHPRGLAGRVG
jgi:hypothetical protein